MEPSPDRIAILLPLGIAMSITFCTVVIHALAMMPMIHFVHYELRLGRAGVRFRRDVAIVAGATLVALAAPFIGIGKWGLVLSFFGEITQLSGDVFYSWFKFTTPWSFRCSHLAVVEIIGTPRRGERHADVWCVNRYAVCHNSALNPDQTRRTKQR